MPLILLTGCLKEDWSLCEDVENCTLLFRYQDPDGADFSRNIEDVHVLLFDRNYQFFKYVYIDTPQLDEFAGVRMSLKPGDYYVVCWGNVDDNISNSNIDKNSTLSGSYVETQPQNGKKPLFYSPYKDIVTRGAETRQNADYSMHHLKVGKKDFEETLHFFQAHRALNVYVIGYDDPVSGPDPQLDVTIANLPCGYDFLLRVLPEKEDKVVRTALTSNSGGTMQAAELYTPYHEIGNDLFIHVNTTDGRPIVAPINLAQFIADNNLPTDPAQLHEINITLKYTGGSVTVTSEKWSEIGTLPEF